MCSIAAIITDIIQIYYHAEEKATFVNKYSSTVTFQYLFGYPKVLDQLEKDQLKTNWRSIEDQMKTN